MTYKDPSRNLTGARHAALREVADLAFIQMDNEISRAYWDKWSKGEEFDWGPFGLQPTPEENRKQFQLLAAMAQAMHMIGFHNINRKLWEAGNPDAVPQSEYRFEDERVDDDTINYGVDKVQEAKDNMEVYTQALGVSTQDMRNYYVQLVKELTGHDIDWSLD